MAAMPVTKPRLYSNANVTPKMFGPITDSTNSFDAFDFVRRAAASPNTLVVCSTDDQAILGQVQDGSKPSSGELKNPPFALFGENHYVLDPTGLTFVMSAIDANGISSTAGVVWSDNWLGKDFAIATTSDAYGTVYQCIDVEDSGTAEKNIFRIAGRHPDSSSTDKNPWVLVRVARSQQS